LKVLLVGILCEFRMVNYFIPEGTSSFSWENNGKIDHIFLPEQNSMSRTLTPGKSRSQIRSKSWKNYSTCTALEVAIRPAPCYLYRPDISINQHR